uniref:Putative TMC-7 n=1 Tax=Cupiennius salei TaxID=6928 RepID=A0A061QLP9_CUPSA
MEQESEESHLNKKVKKSASVRFAPEKSPSDLAFTVIEAGHAQDNSIDIRAEIHNYLPSNTLHRRKLTVFAPTDIKSLTIPRKNDLGTLSLNRIRQLSCPTKKRTFLPQSIDTSDISSGVPLFQATPKQIEIPSTEEEKIEELINIHNLPIPLTEKKLYRNAILNSMRSPQYAIKAKKRTCSDCCSSFLKGVCSRLQLWNSTLKKIEGQFGTGVVSYFVFLRWLILLNFVIFLLYLFLIILPYSVFSLLPHRNTKLAPNETLLTSEFLEQFPKSEDVPYSSKRTSLKNVSLGLDADLISNLGTLLENVPNEILDFTVRYDKKNYTGEERYKYFLYCKDRYEKEMANHTKETFSFLQDFLQGTGWLQSTILFLGFYPGRDVSYFGLPYNLPVSFVAVLIVSFFLSLVLMLQYSSHGIQENILTRKSSYLIFSNILFCSWDYCIEDKKTAAIRHKSITGEIKSNLAEEHRKLEVSRWSSEKRLKVYLLRIVINILVIAALFGCFYLIYKVVNFQLEKQRQNALKDAGVYTLFIQFLPPLVITGLNIMMPVIFYSIAKFEMYATQTQVNIALFRIVFLRLASVFVLVSSLYQQITCEPKDICKAGMSEFCRSPICWETYVGQQLYKLVITDFLVYFFMFLGYDLPRDFIVQKCRCKVTEVIGRQVFDLPSQVLSLVYSQTLCWLGLFYSPLLPGITVLKFFIIFYIKKVVVLKHCIPAPVLYKASRSNTIFMTILMISLFFVTVIHGYSLTSIEPSPGCSPFNQYVVMIKAISDAIADWSPILVSIMTVLFSGFFFIPAFLLLCSIIYYYWTVVVAHRKMIKVLKAQIAIEGRDKQFLLNRLAEAARQVTTN